MTTPIRIRNIGKSFNGKPALKDINLDIPAGEMIALLGSSGCGKTTLLRTIAGLTPPDHGKITFGETDVTRLSVQQRHIGMVFQGYSLFPNMTVRDNIAFPLKAAKIPEKERKTRVDELLHLTKLTERADHHPSQLSGGQQQRTALARALAPNPSVLLLDEPLSALDAIVRDHLRDEIRRIQQQIKTTAILVTHDQSEALAVADRVVIMQAGQIEQVATPEELYHKPSSEFAARFIGTRNVITLMPSDGHVRLDPFFSRAVAKSQNPVSLYVRAEDIKLCSPNEGLQAKVEARLFQGQTTRLYVCADGPHGPLDLRIDAPSRDISHLNAGDAIHVNFEPEDVNVFAS
ncbi:ABC transporter ATP-binding protein [Thalassospira sp. TSL5-1]|uniref:ABC transporter ATP-binding protein n=1 Tax=Thalassospira sp. TSL5-1 TaxID=1544451 RepID=UPI00093C6B6B|nr:ABC transporter ATP-binding protein [Thalassospira sp. TSL5-1]OKH86247.1 hypothetical protein LF95_23475 [Thalassospira sp. TSL5-1]